MTKDLINRITYHLSSGGLFNPELADHLTVRNLLMECREALAQPEPWEKFCDSNCVWTDHHPDCKLAEQEPVAFVKGCNRGQWEIFPAKAYQIFEREQPLYTTPPQRTWVGLTDEEIQYCVELKNPEAIAEEVEAKLKEKNT